MMECTGEPDLKWLWEWRGCRDNYSITSSILHRISPHPLADCSAITENPVAKNAQTLLLLSVYV